MSAKLSIVWLKTGPLHPLDTGGKLRTYNMRKELKRHHSITYLALCPPNTDESIKRGAMEYSDRQVWIPWQETPKYSLPFYLELARNYVLSGLPYIIEKYRSQGMTDAVRELDQSGRCDLIVCDFLTPSVNLFSGGGKISAPTLLFQHNVESLIWQRLYEKAASWPKRFYFGRQWRRMRDYERSAGAQFNGVVAVSEEDCRLFKSDLGLKNVLGAVPTGVDTAYFQPGQTPREPQSLVFLGSMDWMPNIDAVLWFAEEVLPLLKQSLPQINLTIVGRNPPPHVKDLAGRIAGVNVTGTVPDVRPHLARAEVMVVPLRIGGGTRIKIYEGMAAGIPVVSTRIGAEGLPVTHGENILLADSPADFCEQVACLIREPALRSRIGGSGSKFVRENFGWESVNRVFEGHCRSVAGNEHK